MRIRKYDKIEILLSLMLLTVFISKGLFNALSGILLLTAIFKVVKKREINKDIRLTLYSLIPVLGIVVNIFYSGIEGVKNYLNIERGMIFSLIFLVLNLSLVQYERIKNWILIGGVFSGFYSGLSFITPKFFGSFGTEKLNPDTGA